MKKKLTLTGYVLSIAISTLVFSCKKNLKSFEPSPIIILQTSKDANFVTISMAVASAQQINSSKHVQAIIAKQAETAINY